MYNTYYLIYNINKYHVNTIHVVTVLKKAEVSMWVSFLGLIQIKIGISVLPNHHSLYFLLQTNKNKVWWHHCLYTHCVETSAVITRLVPDKPVPALHFLLVISADVLQKDKTASDAAWNYRTQRLCLRCVKKRGDTTFFVLFLSSCFVYAHTVHANLTQSVHAQAKLYQ